MYLVTPTLGLDDPPELDGEGDAVEEGGGEADDDGRGEEGAAAAGVQEGHHQTTPQNCPLKSSEAPKFWVHSQFRIAIIINSFHHSQFLHCWFH